MPVTSSNGASATAVETQRVLPKGASGLLLVGTLGFAAPSSRNPKQFLMDITSRTDEGRTVIESCSGWITDQDGALTPLGLLVTSGKVAELVGRDVLVAVSARASKDRLYLGVEGIWPLGVTTETA